MSLKYATRADRIQVHPVVVERRLEQLRAGPGFRVSWARVFVWLCYALVLAGLAWGALGCAPVTVQQTPTGREVVLTEAKGGVVATALTGIGRVQVDAITLPTNPPTSIILREANDPGLRCHEERHRQQVLAACPKLGPKCRAAWGFGYLEESARVGYWDNRYEVDAREAQALCDAGGSP